MDKKKGLLDTVTQSGWWKQQGGAKKSDVPASPGTQKRTQPQSTAPAASEHDAEQEQSTEGTMTGLFKKLDFF